MSVTVKFAAAADSTQDSATQEFALLVESEPQFQKKVAHAAIKIAPIARFFINTSSSCPSQPQDSYVVLFWGERYLKKEFYAGSNVNFVKFSLCKNHFTKFFIEIHIGCLFTGGKFNNC